MMLLRRWWGWIRAIRMLADMLALYRLMFASEPNVNGRNRGVLGALSEL